MAGMFDDLIPGNAQSGGISFDDLIPQKSGQHLSYEEGLALLAEEERRKRMEGGSGAVGAALTSTIDGIPIAGPILKGATERAAAGLSSIINGRSYSDNLSQAQDLTRTAQEEHPVIKTAGNIVGGVGGTLPAIAAAPWAFGAGPGSLAMRTLASTIMGGGIGGTDAAVRSGGDWDEIKAGAGWGAGTGIVGPLAGDLIGKGVTKIVDALRARATAKAAGTTPYALDMVGRAATRDGLDPATMRTMLDELGPDAMVGDLGPNLQGQVAALANMPGEGNALVREALNARQAGANTRLASGLDDTLGAAIVPAEVDDAIAASQRQVAEGYKKVFENAAAVDTRRIAEGLESQMVNLRGDAQSAVRKVRSMLDITGTDVLDPNPGTLFQTRQAIDGMMETETNSKALAALTEVRKQVDKVLARSVPGIKDVDAAYEQLAMQREALQRGQTVLGEGRTVPRPSELEREVAGGAVSTSRFVGPSGVTARLRQGARAEIDRILGNNANDVARLNNLIKSDGDWNRARLTTLFGKEKADRLFQILESELTFANTRNFAIGNSATAGRQQAIKELGGLADPAFSVRDAYSAGGVPGAIRSVGVKAADRLFGNAMAGRQAMKNADLAEIISSNRDAVLRALAERQMPARIPSRLDPIIRALISQTSTGP